MTDARDVPVDPTSFERLAEQELTYRLIDTASDADTEAFLRADARGFLDREPTDEQIIADRPHLRDRRNVGVFEKGAQQGDFPVATVNAWETPLTVPGGEIEMWAISSVTVAGTHRRRGIARNLLEGELRAAASAGFAMAGLTVSEATIYGRYGFASAIPVAHFRIDTRRAGWAGGDPLGRLEYLDKHELKQQLAVLHQAVRRHRSGQVAGWERRWEQQAGLNPGDPTASAVRGIAFRDEAGVMRGVMSYKLEEIPGAFRYRMAITHLIATTPEARRGLWGFALQHRDHRRSAAARRPAAVARPRPTRHRDHGARPRLAPHPRCSGGPGRAFVPRAPRRRPACERPPGLRGRNMADRGVGRCRDGGARS